MKTLGPIGPRASRERVKHTINFSVLAEERDEDDNILGLKIVIEGKELVIFSIYGPNHHNPDFFNTLRTCLTRLGSNNTVIGGDWNCTVCTDPPDSNIDVLNMQNIPNSRHSALLKKLCKDFEMSDPFRVKFPNRRDFTFFSKDQTKNSRSRLDFFIISNSLIAAPPPLGLHLTLIGYIHAHVERTVTVGLQAKTASAMPVCPPETRTFS